MKIKKTIAAVAAAAMVFTSVPMVAFAEDEAVAAPSAGTVGGNATGTVEKGDVVDGRQEYTVTINSGEGEGENGDSSARKNYHVTIPTEGLTAKWTFDATSGYQFDYGNDATDEEKAFNISNGELKLWLPVDANYCNIVLVAPDGTKKTILVKTVKGETQPTGTKPAGTHAADSVWHKDASTHWHECTIAGCSLPGKKMDIASHDYDWTSEGNTQTGVCECGQTVTVDVTPSSSSSSSSDSAPSGTAGTVPTVASASDMRTSNNTNVNIKAAETKVTPAIVSAFVNNKKAKTMTITYSTALKVAVSKSDIKGTSAALDFSVSGNNFLSSKLMNSSALAKAKAVAQIDFVNKGKIDGVDKVTVQSRVGGKYAGEKATVYEYVDGKLVKIATAKVGGSGLVSFKVDHLGQYVVVVG